MRLFTSLVLAVTLGVVGCGEAPGTGGSGGDGGGGTGGSDPYPGNCGHQGQGGGSTWVFSGLYREAWDGDSGTYRACVFVNEDCTELQASTDCNIGEDTSQAHFLEVEWSDGRTEDGDVCAAAVGVTPEVLPSIPLTGCSEVNCTSFRVEFSDAEGADWLIRGNWSYDILLMTAERTVDDIVCRSHFFYPPDSECLWVFGSETELCLMRSRD